MEPWALCVARYLVKMEGAMETATQSAPDAFLSTLLQETEKIAAEFESELASRGLSYPTPNERRATSRAMLWSAWISWLWAAKSEGREGRDHAAQSSRPIAEKLLDDAIQAGRAVGIKGHRPEQFVEFATNMVSNPEMSGADLLAVWRKEKGRQ